MNTEIKTKKTVEYPVVELEEKGKLIISSDVINQIMYLNSSIGTTEWSGILLYEVISGSISDPKNFVLKAKNIFLMDIGNASYTEYETSTDIIDMYDNVEGSMEMKTAHVHSHHNMSAFFSGTDMEELHDNVDKYNYYLSLIVNFSGNYVAKIAFLSELETRSKMSYQNDNGKLEQFDIQSKSKSMIVINMAIAMEYGNTFFYDRLKQIQKEKIEKEKKSIVKYPLPYNSYEGYGNFRNYNDNDFSNDLFPNNQKTNSFSKKDIKNLTDAEVERFTRNLLSVDITFTETRPVYTLLYTLANNDDQKLDIFYDYFEDNLDDIIEAYFDNQPFTGDELQILINEFRLSIYRYIKIKKIKPVVEKLNEIVTEYYEIKIEVDLEEEMSNINHKL